VLFAQTTGRFWEISFDCQHSQLGDFGPLGIPEVMYQTMLALADENLKHKGIGGLDALIKQSGSYTYRMK
jgi:hypothetical protein